MNRDLWMHCSPEMSCKCILHDVELDAISFPGLFEQMLCVQEANAFGVLALPRLMGRVEVLAHLSRSYCLQAQWLDCLARTLALKMYSVLSLCLPLLHHSSRHCSRSNGPLAMDVSMTFPSALSC